MWHVSRSSSFPSLIVLIHAWTPVCASFITLVSNVPPNYLVLFNFSVQTLHCPLSLALSLTVSFSSQHPACEPLVGASDMFSHLIVSQISPLNDIGIQRLTLQLAIRHLQEMLNGTNTQPTMSKDNMTSLSFIEYYQVALLMMSIALRKILAKLI